jgi:hypothetical protein
MTGCERADISFPKGTQGKHTGQTDTGQTRRSAPTCSWVQRYMSSFVTQDTSQKNFGMLYSSRAYCQFLLLIIEPMEE